MPFAQAVWNQLLYILLFGIKKHEKNTLHFVIQNKKIIVYILLFRGRSKLNKVNVLSALIFYAAATMKIK
jgi:hypothetical protein